MSEGMKFMIGAVIILLVTGIVIVASAGALMYFDAYLKTTMLVQ